MTNPNTKEQQVKEHDDVEEIIKDFDNTIETDIKNDTEVLLYVMHHDKLEDTASEICPERMRNWLRSTIRSYRLKIEAEMRERMIKKAEELWNDIGGSELLEFINQTTQNNED